MRRFDSFPPVLAALALGLVLGLISLPSPLAPLSFLPLAGLLLLWERAPRRRAAGLAFVGGLAYFAAHLTWLPISLAQALGAAWFGVLLSLVWVGLAGYWAAVVWLTRPLGLPGMALGLLLLEYLRTLGPLSFTWGTLGYGLVDTPLAQLADLGGVPLLSALVLLLAGAVVRRNPLTLGSAALALALGLGYGALRLAEPPLPATHEAVLVQGNVNPQARQRVDTLALYRALSPEDGRLPEDRRLVVWPETAVTNPTELPDAPVIAGALLLEFGEAGAVTRNVAIGAEPGADWQVYDKVRQVPFGEELPFVNVLMPLYRPFLGALGLPETVRVVGREVFPITLQGLRYGVTICYESVYAWVNRLQVRRGATVIVNITNDGWFGVGQGGAQHLHMGRLRAVETRRWVLRAANTGVTAAIDPQGRVVDRIPVDTPGVLVARYRPLTGETLYVRAGEWVPALAALALLGLALLEWARRRGRLPGERPTE